MMIIITLMLTRLAFVCRQAQRAPACRRHAVFSRRVDMFADMPAPCAHGGHLSLTSSYGAYIRFMPRYAAAFACYVIIAIRDMLHGC